MRHFLVISILALITSSTTGQNLPELRKTNEKARLRKELFENNRVDTHIPPVDQHTKAVELTFAMETINIQSLDEAKGILSLNCWLKMNWSDFHFKWDPKEYGGVTFLRLPKDLVWKPDITLYNSAHGRDFTPVGEANVIVYSNGMVLWIPPAVFQSVCSIDHKKFPFDEHICKLKFGSWTYDSTALDMQPASEHNITTAIETGDFIENEQWKLIQVTSKHENIKYPCCEETYQSITYELHLKRKPSYYMSIFVMPTFGSILLILSIFWMPPTASGKTIIATFAALLQLAILIALAFKIPPGSDHPPNIISYISFIFSLSTTAMILSVFSIHLARKPNHEQTPLFLRDLPKGILGKIFCLGNSTVAKTPKDGAQLVDNSQIEMDIHGQVPAATEKTADWGKTVQVIERANFVAFLCIYIISAAVCFL